VITLILQVASSFIGRKLRPNGGRCKLPICPMIWKTRRTLLDLTHRARVMGILNVTPDSFSDGGAHFGIASALDHARQMIAEGAELIDIGGESTRPGADAVSAPEEIARTAPVIAALRAEWDGLISIDTSKAAVAEAALHAGADIVNDISGLLADPEMAGVCAAHRCGVVVMHMQGTPQTMQLAPCYGDVVAEVKAFFAERLATLTAAGIDPAALCFDPGIGFGKTVAHNLALLRALGELSVAGRPLLLGVSRKSFIGQVLESTDLSAREWPTVAITANAREKGVMLHRVHSVKPNFEALRMTEAILG
jgi:dihydropteroate synthase